MEFKPDNSRGISKGKSQAQSAWESLKNASERDKLAAENGAFAQCKSYDWEVHCYKLCPEIDPDTNEMKAISATWRTCAP